MQQNNSNHSKDFIVSHIGKPVEQFIPSRQPAKFLRRNVVLFSLFSCICLGFAVMKTTNQVWGDSNSHPSNGRYSDILIPSNASSTNSAIEAQPESYENYQLRILRNQNSIQAEKITALREELQEISQKLHELKPHLFKHGDPADQAKIAQLTQLLGEKEETLNQQTVIKEQLDRDLTAARKKLNEMEIVKEALATMVDSHRSAKEQNIVDFKKQIEGIQLATEIEKSGLLRKIQQHEAIHEKLNQQLTAKGHTINRLDDVATKLNTSLTLKNDELLNLEGHILSLYDEILQISELHFASNEANDQQIQNLVAALDWEQTQTHQLLSFQEEMQWLSDIFIATKEVLLKDIQQLENSVANEQLKTANLSQIKEDLEKHKEELTQLIESHENHLQQKSDYIQQLVLVLEVEQTRSQSLENELLALLKDQEIADHRIDSLEDQLYETSSLLTSKHDELENANDEFNLNLAALLSHLDNAERTSAQTQDEFDQASAAYTENFGTLLSHLANAEQSEDYTRKDLDRVTAKYNENLGTLLSHLDQADNDSTESQEMLEHSKNKYNQDVGTLFLHLDQADQASNQLLNDHLDLKEKLKSVLAKQKQKEEFLQKSLDETYIAYKQENHRLAQLEEQLEETAHNAQLAQIELISQGIIIAAKEKQLGELETAGKDIYEKLSNQFTQLESDLQAEAYRSLNLELLLQENIAYSQHMFNDLIARQEEDSLKTEELEFQIERLTDEIVVKNQINNSISNLYQNTIDDLQAELETKHNLEKELQTDIFNFHLAQEKIKMLEEQIASIEQKYYLNYQVEETIRNLELSAENERLQQENKQLEQKVLGAGQG